MHRFSSLAVFVCLVVVASAQRLQIDVTSVPRDCQFRSKNGDTLFMHYTGRLMDGTKFDSR
jgi:FK506-binding protein 14